jgi:UDP-2,3-diacylglucosamine hydrolase
MTTLFISDLHLCPTRPAINRVFLDFLCGPARLGRALYVLGDLFEYWAGDDDIDDPFVAAICDALAALCAAGVGTYFIRGNRDFLIGDGFAHRSGMTLLDEPVLHEIEGTPTLLMHGDVLCTDDVAYQQFRAAVRSADWQRQFLARPLAERKRTIEQLRRRSEEAKQVKPAAIMDANVDAVVATLRFHAYPRLIHGHTHRPARHLHEVDGHGCERWVLADWYEHGSYLECGPSGCRTVELPARGAD